MKKWLSLLLAVLMLFSLTACTQEEVDTTLEILDTVVSALPEDQSEAVPAPEETLPDSQAPPAEEVPPTPPAADQQPAVEPQPPADPEPALPEDGQYDDKDNVALYIHLYGKLPSNYVTKKDAETLYGWQGGALDTYAPGKAIGGNYYGNYEGLLPDADGREWTECDIGTIGQTKRGAQRIVFSNDGLIYYTPDHYESFELLYGEE